MKPALKNSDESSVSSHPSCSQPPGTIRSDVLVYYLVHRKRFVAIITNGSGDLELQITKFIWIPFFVSSTVPDTFVSSEFVPLNSFVVPCAMKCDIYIMEQYLLKENAVTLTENHCRVCFVSDYEKKFNEESHHI